MRTCGFFIGMLLFTSLFFYGASANAADAKTVDLPKVNLSGSPTPSPDSAASDFGASRPVDSIVHPLGGQPSFIGPTPTPIPLVPDAAVTAKEAKAILRLEYSHTLGNPNYHGDPERGLGFEPASSSTFSLNAGSAGPNPIYLGIGFQWLGDLYVNHEKIDQSANRVFFQLGGEYTLASVAQIDWRIGASVQYFPGFNGGTDDSDSTEITSVQDAFQFQYGAGYKFYTSLHFLKNHFVTLGYESLIYAYRDTPEDPAQNDFYLSHYSVYVSIGVDL
jgi:hypothetical protein